MSRRFGFRVTALALRALRVLPALRVLLAPFTLFALQPAVAAADTAPLAAPPKVLRMAFEVAETGFDPAQISDIYSRDVARNLFDAPLRYAYLAEPGTLEPNTAAAMPQVSADFRTYTVHIKPGIYFIDDAAFHGVRRELVAADYVYSIKRIFDPHWKSYSYATWENAGVTGMKALRDEALRTGRFDYDRKVEGLRAVDRYTLQIRLDHPDPRFASNLADSSQVGAVAREVVELYGDRIMEHPVGTGPFRLAAWRRSSHIELERNREYREEIFHGQARADNPDARAVAARLEGQRLPMLDRVEISIIEESQPRWLAFLNGELDYLERMPRDLTPIAIPGNQLSPALRKLGVQFQRVPEIDATQLVFNMEDPVIGGYTPERIALRRALSLAFDVDEMIRSIYKFQAFPAQSMLMPGTYGYDPSWHTEMGTFDRARANALLDLYGYARGGDGWRSQPSGAPLLFENNTEPDQRSRLTDEIVKKSFDAIGVRTVFKTAKWPENLKAVQSGHYMSWLLGFSAGGPDGGDTLQQGFSPAIGAEDLSRFKLAEYDRLYREQQQLPDGPQRLAELQQLNKLLLAYAPFKAITHRFKIDLNYPWVLNLRDWPFVKDWWRYVDIDTELQARARR